MPHLQLKPKGAWIKARDPSLLHRRSHQTIEATKCLFELGQSLPTSTLESIKPFFNAIVKPELLQHQDRDVKLLVATCVCDITRITAPEAPFSDEIMKDIFQLIVGTFGGLSDTNVPSFGQRVDILETFANCRACVVMLDLECDDLVNEMFNTFFAVVRDDHPENVLSSMQIVMVIILEESEDVREDLLSILLFKLGRDKKGVSVAERRLAMNVIQQSVGKLEPSIKQFLLSLVSGVCKPVMSKVECHGAMYDLCCCAPQILSGLLPYVIGEQLHLHAHELAQPLDQLKLRVDGLYDRLDQMAERQNLQFSIFKEAIYARMDGQDRQLALILHYLQGHMRPPPPH